jgi:hypothetical protein
MLTRISTWVHHILQLPQLAVAVHPSSGRNKTDKVSPKNPNLKWRVTQLTTPIPSNSTNCLIANDTYTNMVPEPRFYENSSKSGISCRGIIQCVGETSALFGLHSGSLYTAETALTQHKVTSNISQSTSKTELKGLNQNLKTCSFRTHAHFTDHNCVTAVLNTYT